MDDVVLRGEETFSEQLRWAEWAKAAKIRLPLWRFACTPSGMRRFLKKLNVPVEQYLADNNEKNLRHFGQMNPDWPLRAWVGIQLEWHRIRNDLSLDPEYKPRRGRPRKETNGNQDSQ